MKHITAPFDKDATVEERSTQRLVRAIMRKSKLSEDEVLTLFEQITTAADLPSPDMDFDDAELNIVWDDHPPQPVTAPVKPVVHAATTLLPTGTHPICIRLPARVIHAFKAQAAKAGCGYQTLMNRALRTVAEGFV